MNKAGLIEAVQAHAPLGPSQAKAFVETFFALLDEGLSADGEVCLHRFGTFELCQRPPKAVRNVATGAPMTLPARKVLRFRAAKTLRQQCAMSAAAAGRGQQLELQLETANATDCVDKSYRRQ